MTDPYRKGLCKSVESASRPVRRVAFALIALLALLPVAAVLQAGEPALAAPPTPPKQATAIGTGGAAASVDPIATKTAIDVLHRGGTAVDAAVAAAAVLGVVEPFSCGIGGGGVMTIYRASDGRVFSLDGRETAPQAFRPDSFIDPATGLPIPFAEGVTSGLGVGVPGTPRLWEEAPARASRSTRPSVTRSPPTSPGSATSRRPASSTAPHRRWGRSSATPIWRRRTRRSPHTGWTRSTAARAQPRSFGPSSIPRSCRARRATFGRG